MSEPLTQREQRWMQMWQFRQANPNATIGEFLAQEETPAKQDEKLG